MKYLLLGFFLCISFTVFGQEMDCKKFKNGTFKLEDAQVGNSLIERKGSKQIETAEGGLVKFKFKVKWLNECTYTLELKKVLAYPKDAPPVEDFILTVEIIEVKENSYIQKSSSDKFDYVVESEMILIDD